MAALPRMPNSAMARQEQDAQRRLNGLSVLLTQLFAAPPGEQLPQVQEALRRDIAAAMNERDALRKAIAERFPDYASLVRPQPATLVATRAALRPGEALLAFYVSERESYVWAVAPTGTPHFSAYRSAAKSCRHRQAIAACARCRCRFDRCTADFRPGGGACAACASSRRLRTYGARQQRS